MTADAAAQLLGPVQIRNRATELGLRPTKARGQNFVVDPNTVRRIVAKARLVSQDVVMEVGPGLGSLTLGLLPEVQRVIAVEVDPVLGEGLAATVATYAPGLADRLDVLIADALEVAEMPGADPTALVSNLPYNVAVPVLLESLASFPSIQHGLVMVQKEVADRLCAQPGSRIYGVPSVKLAWYAEAHDAGSVSAQVFWPVPRVASGLVAFQRHDVPDDPQLRAVAFAAVDAAFAQRRKVLRTSLAAWAGSPTIAETWLRAAGIDPGLRGEALSAADFRRLAQVATAARDGQTVTGNQHPDHP